jgi:hypothetical protein
VENAYLPREVQQTRSQEHKKVEDRKDVVEGEHLLLKGPRDWELACCGDGEGFR